MANPKPVIGALRIAACLLGAALAAPVAAQEAADAIAPESATEVGVFSEARIGSSLRAAIKAKSEGRPTTARKWMIAVANPHAARAGAGVLAKGGTAADAMIAAQSVLGLVEPQSSGIGGGAFLVWYDAATGALTTLDARETAPLAASPRLFQNDQSQPMKFFDAVIGGRSVGVPGVPALMAMAHARWGKAEWAGLFSDAIRLAENGFEVSPRMAALVTRDAKRLSVDPVTRAYFLPGGMALRPGHLLKNPAYANTMKMFAGQGVGQFYHGRVAREIVTRVRNDPANPGLLSNIDMSLYQVRERAPVCAPYRDHEICGMGPPSSGALAVGQILGALAAYDLGQLGPDNPEAWRLIGESSRLAFADRGRYVADSDFVPVPVRGMVAPDYLAQRGALLAGPNALHEVSAGEPEFDHALNRADGTAIERPSTTHISIVDQYGNALSMTSSIENAFGSRVMVAGFLLNNQLTDFSFRSHRNGVPIANRVEPGKRPRSSMAPTMVMKDGAPVLVIGSPGGSRIIGYVAKTIIAHLDWGMDVQSAIALPHLINRFGPYDIEAGTAAEALAAPLRTMGYEVNTRDLNSGLQAIAIGNGLQGGADPRREGVALGE